MSMIRTIIVDAGTSRVWYGISDLLLRQYAEGQVVLIRITNGADDDLNYYGCNVDYWNVRGTILFSVEDLSSSKCLLPVYAWIREFLRHQESVTTIVSLGGQQLEWLVKPLEKEFGVTWKAFSRPTLDQPLCSITEMLGKSLDPIECVIDTLIPAFSEESGFQLFLPPNGELSRTDYAIINSHAEDPNFVVLEPCPIDSAQLKQPENISSIIPSCEDELAALFASSKFCIVPSTGSWLIPLARHKIVRVPADLTKTLE